MSVAMTALIPAMDVIPFLRHHDNFFFGIPDTFLNTLAITRTHFYSQAQYLFSYNFSVILFLRNCVEIAELSDLQDILYLRIIKPSSAILLSATTRLLTDTRYIFIFNNLKSSFHAILMTVMSYRNIYDRNDQLIRFLRHSRYSIAITSVPQASRRHK